MLGSLANACSARLASGLWLSELRSNLADACNSGLMCCLLCKLVQVDASLGDVQLAHGLRLSQLEDM